MRSQLRIRQLVLACVLATTAIPVVAHAAPSVRCLVAFGTVSPSDWCPEDLEENVGEITAISRPFSSAYPKGTLFIRGLATPGLWVTVQVTDGVASMWARVNSIAVEDPSASKPIGAFNAEVNVAALGRHTAEPGADPLTYAGVSELTVIATVDGAATSKTAKVVKYAATPRDTTPPALSHVVWPPSAWHPKLQILNQGDSDGIVRGVATDDPASVQNRASEIGDITITVRQGTKVLWIQDPYMSRPTTVRGAWNVLLKISQFQPNHMPGQDKYTITVEVIDAWGNKVTTTSPQITVWPI